MNSLSTATNSKTVTRFIPFFGRRMPAHIKLRPGQMSHIGEIADMIEMRLKRPAIQEQLVKDTGTKPQRVNKIIVSSSFPKDMKQFHGDSIYLSEHQARILRGIEINIHFSGAVDSVFAHVGALMAMARVLEERNGNNEVKIKYKLVLSGTSSGSMVAALYALYRDAEKVKKIIYNVLKNYSWIEHVDINWKVWRGLIKGNKLEEVLKRCGLDGVRFSDLKVPLFIPAVDLNDKNTYIFCDPKLGHDKILIPKPSDPRIVDRNEPVVFDDSDLVIDAVMASIRMPGLLTLKSIGERDFGDGGPGDYYMIRTIRRMLDVSRQFVSDLSNLSKSLERYSEKNIIDVVAAMVGLADIRQKDGYENPELNNLHSRIIRPGVELGTPEAYNRGQEFAISHRETFEELLRMKGEDRRGRFHIDRFFSKLRDREIGTIYRRMSIERMGGPDSNRYSFEDKKPEIIFADGERRKELFKKDGGEIKIKSFWVGILSIITGPFRRLFGMNSKKIV